jgi:hypothetical protein
VRLWAMAAQANQALLAWKSPDVISSPIVGHGCDLR